MQGFCRIVTVLSFVVKPSDQSRREVRLRDVHENIFRPDLDEREAFDPTLLTGEDESSWRDLKSYILDHGLDDEYTDKVFEKCRNVFQTDVSEDILALALWVIVHLLRDNITFSRFWNISLFEISSRIVVTRSTNLSLYVQAVNLLDLSTKAKRDLVIPNDVAMRLFEVVRNPPDFLIEYRHLILKVLARQFQRISIDDTVSWAIFESCASLFTSDDPSLLILSVTSLRKLVQYHPMQLQDYHCERIMCLSRRGYVDLLVAVIRFFTCYSANGGHQQLLRLEILAEFAKNTRIIYPKAELWFLRMAAQFADASLEGAQQCSSVLQIDKYIDSRFDVQVSTLKVIAGYVKWKIWSEISGDLSAFVISFLDSDQEQVILLSLNIILSDVVVLDSATLLRIEELAAEGNSDEVSRTARVLIEKLSTNE